MRNTSSDESPLKGSGEADLERERERGDLPSLGRGVGVGEGDAVRRRFLPSLDRSRGDLEFDRSRSAVSFTSNGSTHPWFVSGAVIRGVATEA